MRDNAWQLKIEICDNEPKHAKTLMWYLMFDDEEELEDEQVGEDEDNVVLDAYYSVLDLLSDNPLRRNED